VVGRTVSHYRVVKHLGAGGMGVVYAAEDLRLGRQVALKFIPEELARNPLAIERLKTEARAASALNHPNICTIYDIDEHEGRPFIVMELMEGETLRDRLRDGPLKTTHVVDFGIQIADALDAAASRGIVHRDIKPANLFVTARGQVKILDFGVAKLASPHAPSDVGVTLQSLVSTAEGVMVGTVSYMSPEQATGEQLDGRTDVFSLGVVLYECLTGHQPFTGKTSAVVLSAILNRAPLAPVVYNPEIPSRLQEVLNNCLEKDRELRYQDAAGLRADLRRVKRDLESGVSAASAASSRPAASAAVTPPAGVTDGVAAPVPIPRDGSKGLLVLAVALVAVVLLAVATSQYLRQDAEAPGVAPSDAATTGLQPEQLALATASLQVGNYRAALAQAEQVLATSPDEPGALRIRDEASAALGRFDEAIADARELLAAGEISEAADALERARAIDPTAAGVSELSSRLVERARAEADAARRQTPAPATPRPQPPRNEPPRSVAATPLPPAQTAPPARPRVDPAPVEEPAVPEPSIVVSAPRAGAGADGGVPSEAAPSPATATPAVPPPAGNPVRPITETAPEPVPEAPQPEVASRGPVEAAVDHDAAIRRVIADYARAIETKDVSLFRSLKPNLSSDEERRIEEGFRAVSSQQVDITILSIERNDAQALVRLRRRDTIDVGGRRRTSESLQTITLTLDRGAWVINELGT